MPRIELPLVPVFVLLLSVAACATMPPPGAGPMPGGLCNADAASAAVGNAASPDVVERARMDSGSSSVRVIAPGQSVTMDYLQDRLNINVNERGAIVGLKCG